MIQEAFWTHDYVSGVEALRDSLKSGNLENKQFLAMVRERARIEHLHASQLAFLSQDPALQAPERTSGPRSSTLQASMDAFNAENVNNAVLHTRIATDLEKKVHDPLLKWCNMYSKKVDTCVDRLFSLVSRYQRLLQETTKQRAVYYERCRRNEDVSGGNSPRDPVISTIRMLRERLNTKREQAAAAEGGSGGPAKPAEFVVAGLEYSRQELADLLHLLLSDIVLTEYKVPLLGSYPNVCSGSALATAARRHLRNDSFAYTEKFGQSLVDLGFLKPVGQISNKFQSTHNSHYQWQPAAFELLEEASDDSENGDSGSSRADSETSVNSAGSTSSVLAASDASEERYLQGVLELDVYRCEMEVEVTQIYEFLDRLARDRERAIQAGMRDFIKAAFRLEDQRDMQLRLDAAQSAVNPEVDLADLVARYETGPFIPTVTVFKGYYNDSVAQTFGVDLDQSRFFIDLTLNWLEAHREDVANIDFWTNPEPIAEAYKLRAQVNTGRPFNAEGIFKFFTPSVVISTFLHFLLELPESLIPFTVYDRVKQVYSTPQPDMGDVVQTLLQVPVENLRALHQLIDYLHTLFKAESEWSKLAKSLALPLVRPRAPSAVTMHDRHPQLIVYDLLSRASEIFKAVATQQAKLDEMKDPREPRVHRLQRNPPDRQEPANPTEPQMADTPTPDSKRVVSANTLRPLSLASPRSSSRANMTEPGNESATTPIRGLGINAMLPIAKTPIATPPTSPGDSRNISPQQTSSPGLRPLRTSMMNLEVQKRQHKHLP